MLCTGCGVDGRVGRRVVIRVSSKKAVLLIRRARRPILIVGSMLTSIKLPTVDLVKFVVNLAEFKNMIVIVSRNSEVELRRHYDKVVAMNMVEFTFKLCELGKLKFVRECDLLIFIAHRLDVLQQVTSALKNYVPELRTLGIDRFYCEHVMYSFPTLELSV